MYAQASFFLTTVHVGMEVVIFDHSISTLGNDIHALLHHAHLHYNITAVHMGMTNYPGTHKPLHNSEHTA